MLRVVLFIVLFIVLLIVILCKSNYMHNYKFYAIINNGRCYMKKFSFDIKSKIRNKKKKNIYKNPKSVL